MYVQVYDSTKQDNINKKQSFYEQQHSFLWIFYIKEAEIKIKIMMMMVMTRENKNNSKNFLGFRFWGNIL